jgi:hypothetical protein
LRCLDLVGAHGLQEVDLSACAAGIHLTVRDCPALSRVHLPASGVGAVVHLDAGCGPPGLEVFGLIDSFDACWAGGEFAVGAGKHRRAYCGAWFGETAPADNEHELVVLSGSGNGEAVMDVAASAWRELVIRDRPSLERLALDELAHVERIDVAGCESLNAVEGAGNCRRLTLARCPRIQRISVSGQVARLDHCATEREPLAVEGSWSRLVVLGTDAPGLDAPGVGHLFVRDSPAIRHASLGASSGLTLKGASRLSTDFPGQAARLDEQAVSGLLERAAEGEAAAERMLHEWCGQAVGPREMLDTLRALARFAERHAAPELLWTLRCELAAANRKKAAHAGVSPGEAVAAAQRHWHWRFPADLEQEGWEADVRLWVACRGWAPVQRCGRLLVRDRRLVPVVALIGCLGERPWDDDLRTLLLRALSYRYRHLCWGTDAEHRAQLGRLVQAALTLRDTAVAQGVANLVVCMLAPDACLRLLGPLVSAGHGGARALAMSFTRGGGAEPDLRARAMAVALAPARSELFDTGEGNHGD